METMKEIMAHFRAEGLSGFNVVEAIDYKDSDRTGLPAADVLKFYLEGGSWIAVRPSGTEPKIKFYFSSVDETAEAAEARLETMRGAMEDALAAF
jgi:phosphoglucomutase